MAASSAAKGVLGELAKRVPKNQSKQFKTFLDLNAEYKRRVNKYPEKLPRIDWEYYRANVRMEAVKIVDEFEKKYEELNKVFDERTKLDTKKYYDELEKERTVVQAEVNQFITESNERIKAYEAELLRICSMKPYSSMTMEEFITLRPELSTLIPCGGKPLFWPHDEEEQKIGPVGIPGVVGGKGGGGGDDSAGGDGHTFTPSDIKGKTENFEFNPGQKQTPVGAQATAVPKPVQSESPSGVVTKTIPGKKGVPEPKIQVHKPASEETKRKMDPCNLDERLKHQSEAKTNNVTSAVTKATVKPVEKQAVPPKKPHPCDLVAGNIADRCKDAPKEPYKDETKSTCIFFDPCKTKFGAGIKSDTKPAEKVPGKKEPTKDPKEPSPCDLAVKEKAAKKSDSKEPATNQPVKAKSETKDGEKSKSKDAVKADAGASKKPDEKKPGPPEKPHPCELVALKLADPCKNAPKGPYKNEKGDSCVFFDPCKVKFGAGINPDTKAAKEKAAGKSAIKELPCEEKKKLEADVVKDKDSCTMVFAEPSNVDKKPPEDEKKKSADFSTRPPFYNPFANHEDCKKKEEKTCGGKSEDSDNCEDKGFYNPCNDDKEKK